MNDVQLTWYMHELCMHSLGACQAFTRLDHTVHSPETRQTRFVWFHLVSFLGHAAMISKYLDPVGRMNDQKRKRITLLKDNLSVEKDSPVLPRDARDNVEHFDERIDNWGSDCSSIIECVFENRDGFVAVDREGTRVKRVLLVEECVFISESRDQSRFEVELLPLRQEIQRIGDAAENWIENDSPFQFVYPN